MYYIYKFCQSCRIILKSYWSTVTKIGSANVFPATFFTSVLYFVAGMRFKYDMAEFYQKMSLKNPETLRKC